MIHADTWGVVVVGRPLSGNRNDCEAWAMSGAKDAVGRRGMTYRCCSTASWLAI
ncbi:hypothetical protein SLAVM298S_00251 [Streptomyces lavendulae subsp. lavendulae]